MIAEQKDKKASEPTPKDAQKGGQGAVGIEDKEPSSTRRAIQAPAPKRTDGSSRKAKLSTARDG